MSIVGAGFDLIAKTVAKMEGSNEEAIAIYPGVIMTDKDEVFAEKVRSHILPAVLAKLVSAAGTDGAAASGDDAVSATGERSATSGSPDAGDGFDPDTEFAPDQIVARGSLAEVTDLFYERMWTDGLPIIPPTLNLVREFVERSGRAGSDVVGILMPSHREATVWSIAVNAVMAGCRPEYMPVLIALVECLADRRFALWDGGSTPGWEPLVVVSGAVVDDLKFNAAAAATRGGRQANTTIGRFARLYMRNIAGLLTPPGSTDQAGFGYNFNVALAENQAALDDIGWTTLREDEGFARSQSTVSVQSSVSVSSPIYSAGSRAEQHLSMISEMMLHAISPGGAFIQYYMNDLFTVLAMGPSVARVVAEDGWTKDDVRRYIGDHMRLSARVINARAGASVDPHFRVQHSTMGREFLASQDIDPSAIDESATSFPALVDIGKMAITVSGNPARNQSRGFVNNGQQGRRVTKAVGTP